MAFSDMFSKRTNGSGGGSKRISTKYGVRTKRMANQRQSYVFALLPALDPENADRNTSALPAILPGDPEDTTSDWGFSAFLAKGVGHGAFSDRADIISLKTFGEYCPLVALHDAVRADMATWGYLTKSIGTWGQPGYESEALPWPKETLYANVYLPAEPEKLAQVGVFDKNVAIKLLSRDDGIVWAPSAGATDAMIAADYMAAYANGDITNPLAAPLFVIEKMADRGRSSGYSLRFQVDGSRRVQRLQLTPQLLGSRYNMSDPHEFLNILSAEDIVQLLVQYINGRSPAGYHEYALLNAAFGDKFKVPEPPSAPGALSTVQSGFEPAAPAPVAPVAPPPVAPAAPAPAPVAPPVAPAAPVGIAHIAPQPGVPTAQPTSPEMNAVGNAAIAAIAAQGGQPAAVPGDAVPKFDRNAFLAKFRK